MNLLSNEDSERLIAAGYTLWEIDQFASATTPDGQQQPAIDLSKKPWIDAMESRSNWYSKMIADGWTYQQYEQAIYEQYNRNPNQSPWDFLKSEYKPPQHADFRTTIEATKRVRNFKTSVRRQLRTDSKKIERDIRGVSSNKEEQEYFSRTLGDTIRRLNKQ